MRLRTGASLVALMLISCSDEVATNSSIDTGRLIFPDQNNPDLQIISTDVSLQQDSLPAINCENPNIAQHEEYCHCLPQCCSTQEWWCPPQPDNTIQSMMVIVEVCNDSGEQCEFGVDIDCPPPQIIHQGECRLAFECPPGSSRDFLQWFECRMPDGMIGQQRVLCDKGRIMHGPCVLCEQEQCDGQDNDCDDRVDEDPIPCENQCGEGLGVCRDGEIVECIGREPTEEVCNFIDDDCDGLIDEGQRNDCNDCGELPKEICDGVDNDCDGATDEELIRECETICDNGLETCIAGRWASCTARQPMPEECDGLDNDCDGLPDEGINCICTPEQVGALYPCAEAPLACGSGFKTCECLDVDCEILQMGECKALCAHFPNAVADAEPCDATLGRIVEDEVCNNFDEDCDEEIDEQLAQACYTGPRNTINVGICVPGQQTCREGRWGGPNRDDVWTPDICEGEVVPQEEVCNGSDDDCDGSIDYGEELRPTDILFIVDSSGSMLAEVRAVTSALSRFGQHFSAEEALHWGLIVGPTRILDLDQHPTEIELLSLVSNISEFELFFDAFMSLNPLSFEGGLEMLIDAVMLSVRNLAPLHVDMRNRQWQRGIASDPVLDQFFVRWRQNTDRIIILFSDEDEQSLLNPRFRGHEVEAAVSASPNTKMYAFVPPFYGWDEIAIGSGGGAFPLSRDSEEMYNNLMTIIDEACLPRQDNQQGNIMSIQRNYELANYTLWESYEENMCY